MECPFCKQDWNLLEGQFPPHTTYGLPCEGSGLSPAIAEAVKTMPVAQAPAMPTSTTKARVRLRKTRADKGTKRPPKAATAPPEKRRRRPPTYIVVSGVVKAFTAEMGGLQAAGEYLHDGKDSDWRIIRGQVLTVKTETKTKTIVRIVREDKAP